MPFFVTLVSFALHFLHTSKLQHDWYPFAALRSNLPPGWKRVQIYFTNPGDNAGRENYFLAASQWVLFHPRCRHWSETVMVWCSVLHSFGCFILSFEWINERTLHLTYTYTDPCREELWTLARFRVRVSCWILQSGWGDVKYLN